MRDDMAGAGDEKPYLVYTLISAAFAVLITAAYAFFIIRGMETFVPIHGRNYEIFKGVAQPQYWPETLGEEDFFLSPSLSILSWGFPAGMYANIGMVLPVSWLMGVNYFTVTLCCVYLAIGNFCGIFPLYGSCRILGISPRSAFLFATAFLLNPFFILKISWDPILGFGMLIVLYAFYAYHKGKPVLWMFLVLLLPFAHPVGLFTAAAWFLAELFMGKREYRRWVILGLKLVVVTAVYRAATMGVELIFFKDRSWLHYEFGNATSSVIPLILQGRWQNLCELLQRNIYGLVCVAACAGFFMASSRKYLFAAAPEFLYILLGIDGVENGCVPTFVGLIFAVMIDGHASNMVSSRRIARAVPAIALAGAVAVLVLFSRGYFTDNKLFTSSLFASPSTSEPRRKLINEAIKMIPPDDSSCATNPQIASHLSRFCRNTISLHTLFPMDLKTDRNTVSPHGLLPDWILVDVEMLQKGESPTIHGTKDDVFFIISEFVKIIKSEKYDLVFGEKGVLLLKKR